MTAKQWRGQGFRTIFHGGEVYLYELASTRCWRGPIERGRWMEFANLAGGYWTELLLAPEHVRSCVGACYCDRGVDLCDFCGGLRSPPQEEGTR